MKSFFTALALAAGLLAATLLASLLFKATDRVRTEVGGFRVQTLAPALVAQIEAGEAPLSAMLFITQEADQPSDRRGLEAGLTELLANLAGALPGRFTFGVTDPALDEDMARFASRRGIVPFRALGRRGDTSEAKELYASLLLDWGPRGSARLEHLGPEHLPVLQSMLRTRLAGLLAPTRPSVAILAPSGADFAALEQQLGKHADVRRFDPAADDFDWEELYASDLALWMRPGASAAQALPEVERFIDSGRSLVIAGSPFGGAPAAGLRPLAAGLGVTLGQAPIQAATATETIDSIAPDQDFRLLTGQPNGTLHFEAPAALSFDAVVLARRKTSAHVLATSREGVTKPDPAGTQLVQPKRALVALLDPADSRRGRVVFAAATAPFENLAQTPENGAHLVFLDTLFKSFTGADRRALLAALPHPPRAVPESSSATRLWMRTAVFLPLPLLLAFALLRRRQGNPKPTRGPRLAPRLAFGFALVLLATSLLPRLAKARADLTEDGLSRPAQITLEIANGLSTKTWASAAAPVQVELFASPPSKLPGDLALFAPRLAELVRAATSAGAPLELHTTAPEDLDEAERETLARVGILPFTFDGPVGLGGQTARSAWASVRLSVGSEEPRVLSFESGAELDELEFRFALALETLALGRAPRIGFASDLPRMSAAEDYEFQSQGRFAPREGDVFGRARRALERAGFDVVHVNPRGSDSELEAAVLDQDLDAILWLQPRREMRPMLAALARFVTRGGRAMIAAQHFRTQARRYRGADYETVFWPQPQPIDVDRFWLPEFGVSLERRVQFDALDARLPIESRETGKSSETEFAPLVTRAPFLVRVPTSGFQSDPLMRGVADLSLPDPTRIALDTKRLESLGLTVRPLFHGSPQSWSLDWQGGWLPDDVLDATNPGRTFDTPPLYGAFLEGIFPAPALAWGGRDVASLDDLPAAPGALALLGNSAVFTDELLPSGGGEALLLNIASELALRTFGPHGQALAHLAGRRPIGRGLGLVTAQTRTRAKLFVIAGNALPIGLLLLLFTAIPRMWRGFGQPKRSHAPGPLPWRPALASIVLATAALFGTQSLAESHAASRAGTLVFGRALPPAVRAKTIAALRLVAPASMGGGHWTYVHQAGNGVDIWRELEGAGALGDPESLLATIEDLFEAEGQVVTRDNEIAGGLGFTPDAAWRIELFDPADQDQQPSDDATLLESLGKPFLQCELGLASRDGRGLMLRITGDVAVWSVDRNPRYRIEGTLDANAARRQLAAAPPLADQRLAPASWPGLESGLATLAWQREGGKSLRLVEVAVERTPEELQAGKRPTGWRLVGQGTDELFDPAPIPRQGAAPPPEPGAGIADKFLAFVARSTYTELLDPSQATALGLGPGTPPMAILLFGSRPTDAAPKGFSFTLSIGPELPASQGGGHAAIHGASRNLIRLSSDFVNAALATPGDFHSPEAQRQWRVL